MFTGERFDGLLRLPEVLRLIPVGKSTWWAGVASGRFPKPVKFPPRITMWRAAEIYSLINSTSNAGQEVPHE
jgi:predicted DNA-binding transcriptional regulator AlpA